MRNAVNLESLTANIKNSAKIQKVALDQTMGDNLSWTRFTSQKKEMTIKCLVKPKY